MLILLTLNFSVAQDSTKVSESNHIVRFQWSNDFIHQTDQYFSNGFLLEYYNPIFEHNPFNFILFPRAKAKYVLEGISLTQDLFTPIELTDTVKQKADRPFAAYILIGAKRVLFSLKYKLRLTSEIQVGIIGESAMGKEIQNGIHDLLPTSSWVYGWANQIRDDFCINYFAQIEKEIYGKDWYEFNWVVSTKLGSPYTYLDAGTTFRFGKFDQKYLRDFESLSNLGWQSYFFADLRVRLVGYNATLQGGLFNNNSIYTIDNINRVVADLVTGINYSHKNFKIELAQHYMTKAYPEAKIHRWGYLNLRFGF